MQSNWGVNEGTADGKLKAGLGPDGQKNPKDKLEKMQ